MLELMMTDLPHIQYHPKDIPNERIVKMQDEVRKAKMQQLKKEGMSSIFGGLNFKPSVGNVLKKK